jgi:hypothetical protein
MTVGSSGCKIPTFSLSTLAVERARRNRDATVLGDRLHTFMRDKMASLNDGFEACTRRRDHWTRDRLILRGAKG